NLADVTFKKHVCAGLEVASAFLEKSLPRAMGLINIDTREQFNERCRSGAIELRDMQVRLSLMDGKTVDTLKHDIVRYIGIVTQGKYGLLPTGAPAIRDESKKSVFVRIIKGVFIAFIPIGCLLGAKYAGLGLAGAVANWALIAGLGWAALTLISTLDPKYRTRLNDIRSIVSMIRGQGNQ